MHAPGVPPRVTQVPYQHEATDTLGLAEAFVGRATSLQTDVQGRLEVVAVVLSQVRMNRDQDENRPVPVTCRSGGWLSFSYRPLLQLQQQ